MLTQIFLVLLATTSIYCDQHFTVDILESGMLIKQDVTIKDSLEIIHVPAHRGLVEIELYIDFENELQLVKLINENKCQLSKKNPQTKPILYNDNQRQTTPLDSSTMQHTRIVRLESSEPLTNLSYLRQEMQIACANLPTFWVEDVEENVYHLQKFTRSALSINGKNYQLAPYIRGPSSLSCPQGGGMVGPHVQCHPECFYQLCNPNGGHWCYYTATHCPMVTTSCWQHLNNIPLNCRPCCSSPDVPCGTKLPYCGCYAK